MSEIATNVWSGDQPVDDQAGMKTDGAGAGAVVRTVSGAGAKKSSVRNSSGSQGAGGCAGSTADAAASSGC